jgi:DNA-binding response OmpR family regulator
MVNRINQRILIADDNMMNRQLLRQLLEKENFDCFEAVDGKDAISKIVEIEPDLITLNIDMPFFDGYEVCSQIKNETMIFRNGRNISDVPVIFITGNDTIEGRNKGFKVGATDFISKPFSKEETINSIKQILQPERDLFGLTVLIVDNSFLAKKIISNSLASKGVNVLEAEDGASALDILYEHKSKIDLVLTNFEMPKLNGIQLCLAIRNHLKMLETPVVFLTSKEDRNLILKIFKAGATDYLVKPFTQEELIARLNVHLQKKLLKEKLEDKVLKLEQYHIRTKQNLKWAWETQKTMISDQIQMPFLNTEVLFEPVDEVSGDFYYFSQKDQDCFYAFLGDAVGHGVAAAFLTITIQTQLNHIDRTLSCDEVLTKLNKNLTSRHTNMSITGIYVKISSDGLLTTANAAHPRLIIIPSDSNQEIKTLKEGGTAIGWFSDLPMPYVEESYQLAVGDKVLIYTDGVTEWTKENEDQFEEKRLFSFLEQNRNKKLDETLKGLKTELFTFSEGKKCEDDLTVLAFEYTGK